MVPNSLTKPGTFAASVPAGAACAFTGRPAATINVRTRTGVARRNKARRIGTIRRWRGVRETAYNLTRRAPDREGFGVDSETTHLGERHGDDEQGERGLGGRAADRQGALRGRLGRI